jgi:hypothetical protein
MNKKINKSVVEKATLYVAAMPPAVTGQGGHDSLYRVAVALRHGFDLTEEEAWPILLEYNERCTPLWSESELKHKLAEGGNPSRQSRPQGHLRTGHHTPPAKPAKPAKPLRLRLIPWKARVAEIDKPDIANGVEDGSPTDCLIDDGRGNIIPDHPGQVVPLTELHADNPVVMQLKKRGYNIADLYNQFRGSFCTKEVPADWKKGREYRQVHGDFLDTPQNRIVFFADMNGVQRGWQALVVDCVHGDLRYYLHPYTNQWIPKEHKNGDHWEPLPLGTTFHVSKWLTGPGVRRDELLMGFDAAIRWNATNRPGRPPITIVSRTPLEAGRFGPPGMALLSRYFSRPQFNLLAVNFGALLYAGQNDELSHAFGKDIEAACAGKVQFGAVYPPDGFHGFDEMTTLKAIEHVFPALNQLGFV